LRADFARARPRLRGGEAGQPARAVGEVALGRPRVTALASGATSVRRWAEVPAASMDRRTDVAPLATDRRTDAAPLATDRRTDVAPLATEGNRGKVRCRSCDNITAAARRLRPPGNEADPMQTD